MQDKRIKPETIPRENPAVTPFAADESASGLQTFECDLFDLLSNAPDIAGGAQRSGRMCLIIIANSGRHVKCFFVRRALRL